MSLIAIASGEGCNQTFNLLKHIYASSLGIQAPDIKLLNMDKSPDIDILILGAASESSGIYTSFLKKGGFLLINSDEKPAKAKIRLKDAIPISYGFDAKSSITSSSISHDNYKTLQICIQRPLPTISGKTVIEQEFSVSIEGSEINNHSILAAVTAALVNDFPPEAFSDAVYSLPGF